MARKIKKTEPGRLGKQFAESLIKAPKIRKRKERKQKFEQVLKRVKSRVKVSILAYLL